MAPPAAELAIAKASFSAVLFRPEPTSCSRDEIEQFHGLLGETISRCSPTNVQKCKQWALHHLVRSPARASSLGKYLVALANTYTSQASSQPAKPSPKRRRLHIIFILSDIFYHVKQRLGDETFISSIGTHLPALVKSAASFSNCPKHIRKLENLISLWEDNKYFAPHYIKELRRAVEDGPVQSSHAEQNSDGATQISGPNSKTRDAPFVMPSMHGDATTPWYDLPAGNWLPVIEPNSTRPMNPSMIRPLQLASGPPEKTLVDAVKKLLVDVDKIYAKDVGLDGDASVDIGQTGEFIERDEINGDIISGDTYYGWSRAFCQKMKARRKGGPDESRGRASSRSRSRSLSRSPSRDRSSSRGPRPAFKRRRLSSTSRSPSGSARREKYPDLSRSPSRSRSRSRRRSYSRPEFQRSSRSYSRSRSPPPRRNFGRELDSGHPSGSPHYSSPPSMPPSYSHNGHFNQPPPPPLPNMPPIPPPQPNYGGWNVPPPPPPPPPGGYQGQWPPPPPAGGPPQQNWFPPNSNQWVGGWGGVPPPPPPPPPISQQQGGYHYGRGGGGGYRGARGGYNNRGRGW